MFQALDTNSSLNGKKSAFGGLQFPATNSFMCPDRTHR